MSVEVRLGDCLDPTTGLACLAPCSVDAMVTDPPAGIGFMGRTWDSDKGGRASWVAWMTDVMRAALAALKPGAHALVWALPRTSHWTATAMEDAGFQIRDVITHHFGSGFPKSLDVSKAIDEAARAARAVVGVKVNNKGDSGGQTYAALGEFQQSKFTEITAPATDAAKQWTGWGTALKPGTEHWILARKPLAGTVAGNVQEHGTGALNIDACRVETSDDLNGGAYSGEHRQREGYAPTDREADQALSRLNRGSGVFAQPTGRWPANVAFTHSFACDDDGCAEDCPVRELDEKSGELVSGARDGRRSAPKTATAYGAFEGATESARTSSVGGSSRFFKVFRQDSADFADRFIYCAKPATSERETGLDHLPRRAAAELTGSKEGQARLDSPRSGAGRTSKGRANHHPTVKSLGLMTWLTKLITPPRGLVIDPFAGSGTGGVAACRHRFRWIGWEADPDFHALATERLRRAVGQIELCA